MAQNRTRNKSVTLWLTEEEREQLRVNAAWFAMTQQEFLRHAALGNTVERPPYRHAAARRKKVLEGAE